MEVTACQDSGLLLRSGQDVSHGSPPCHVKTAESSFEIYSGEDKFTSKETISRGLENVNIFGKSSVKPLI